jgi:hypothetical protein
MNRAPDTKPRCNACESTNVTVSTKFDPSEGWSYLHFRDTAAAPGLFSTDDVTIAIDRARVCLDCGNVMLSLGAGKLAALRARLSKLEPYPE